MSLSDDLDDRGFPLTFRMLQAFLGFEGLASIRHDNRGNSKSWM